MVKLHYIFYQSDKRNSHFLLLQLYKIRKPILCYSLFYRFRPTNAKPKKTKTESKLEFFGFEDKEEEESEEGSEGGMPGKSSYKIKYFGFDDLSESDSDEESSQAKEKKTKKAAAVLAALSSSMDSPHTSDSQDSQTSNTGELMLLIWSYSHINNFIPVYAYIDYQHIQPSSVHVQKFTPILFV